MFKNKSKKMADVKKIFKVGSRKSELALMQTNYVINLLKDKFPEKTFEIITMVTMGDQILDKPLPKIGEKSLFTRELENALYNNEVDFVVHSLKDLPTVLPTGLTIGAILKREDPRDAVITNSKYKSRTLDTLPKGSVIGTSSLRRAAQLARNFPHLKVESIRGNLNTRLRKLEEDGKYSALVLAAAGMNRLKWEDRITQLLEPSDMLYAVGQGALAVECSADNEQVLAVLEQLNDRETILNVIAERSFLQTLGGGCTAPVAVHTKLDEKDVLSLTGAVWSLDGTKTLQKTATVQISSETDEPPRKCPFLKLIQYSAITARNFSSIDQGMAHQLGTSLARALADLGAVDIISEAKKLNELPITPEPIQAAQLVSVN